MTHDVFHYDNEWTVLEVPIGNGITVPLGSAWLPPIAGVPRVGQEDLCAPGAWWTGPSGAYHKLPKSLDPRGAVLQVIDRLGGSTPVEPCSLGSMPPQRHHSATTGARGWDGEHVAMMAVDAGRWRPDLVLIFIDIESRYSSVRFSKSVLWWILQM